MAISRRIVLLRRTSVGCAVRTGRISLLLKNSRNSTFARRRARDFMPARAANVMLVLSQIRKVRKVAEGSHDLDRLFRRQPIECGFEVGSRTDIIVAVKRNGTTANVLDELKNHLSFLRPYGVAEHAAEEPDIVAQRTIFVAIAQSIGADLIDRAGHCRRHHIAKLNSFALARGQQIHPTQSKARSAP